MKLVVGLGNPGAKYEGTRHNVGFAAVDLVAKRHGLEWQAAPRGVEALIANWRMGGAILAKPLTFMNLSGAAVVGLLQFYKIPVEEQLVIVDESQLDLGRLRIRLEGSAGGHNGLKSIIQHLGTQAFPRVRVGVGRGDDRRDLSDHVLGRFETGERDTVSAAVLRAADAAERFLSDGIERVMSAFNAAEKKDSAE